MNRENYTQTHTQQAIIITLTTSSSILSWYLLNSVTNLARNFSTSVTNLWWASSLACTCVASCSSMVVSKDSMSAGKCLTRSCEASVRRATSRAAISLTVCNVLARPFSCSVTWKKSFCEIDNLTIKQFQARIQLIFLCIKIRTLN